LSTDDTDPGFAPDTPGRYTIPASRAEVRKGEAAPAHDHGQIDDVGAPEAAFIAMRNLHRVARDPFNDPAYHRYSSGTRQYHELLKRQVREKLDDDELFELMLEARSYLLRRDA
jgi:hypothetical protein